MKYIVTVVERTVKEVTVEASNPEEAMDKAHEDFMAGVATDYAIDIGVEFIDWREDTEEGREAGEEEVRRQSRPDDVT